MTADLLDSVVARNRAMAGIRDCTSCPLHSSCNHPIPFRGATPSPFLLIGESPTPTEDKYGKLWIGRWPKYLDILFHDLGLPPIGNWVVTNTVNCTPPEQRVPSVEEVHKCSIHLRAVVDVANPTWVLTLGTTALSATGVKGALNTFHGRPFLLPAGIFVDRWIFPTYDPRATLHSVDRLTDLRADLSTLSRLIDGTLDPASLAARVGRGGKLFLPE